MFHGLDKQEVAAFRIGKRSIGISEISVIRILNHREWDTLVQLKGILKKFQAFRNLCVAKNVKIGEYLKMAEICLGNENLKREILSQYK